MSFYYEHNWYRIRFASGRQIVLYALEADDRTFKGNMLDTDTGEKTKSLRVVQRHQIETLDILTEEQALEIARDLQPKLKTKGRKPGSSDEPLAEG